MMVNKEHFISKGLLRIVAIKSFSPKGLSPVLRNAFPSLPSVSSFDFIPSTLALDAHWVVGFTNADGSFSLGYRKDDTYRLAACCIPFWKVTQHQQDLFLLKRIQSLLNCGSIYSTYNEENAFDLKVTGL